MGCIYCHFQNCWKELWKETSRTEASICVGQIMYSIKNVGHLMDFLCNELLTPILMQNYVFQIYKLGWWLMKSAIYGYSTHFQWKYVKYFDVFSRFS